MTRSTQAVRADTEAELRSLAQFPEENPNPVLRAAGDGAVLYANGPARALLESMGWREGLPLPEPLLAPVQRVLGGGQYQETELTCPGARVWSFAMAPVSERRYVNLYGRDATDRKRAESLLQTRLRLSEVAQRVGMEELLQTALDEAELLTGSRIGFFHFVDDDQENLTLQAWSTNTLQNMCKAEGKGRHYPISQAGVWVDCFHARAPVIHNDYAGVPHKKGLPEGHAPVVRELVVPILRGGSVVAIIGVGNKPANYTLADADTLRDLATPIMDLVARKRAEEALRRTAEELARSNRDLEQFAYVASHDLQEPLRMVTGFVQLLQHNCGDRLGADAKKYIDFASDGAKRMQTLINDLLAYSRVGTQAQELQPTDAGAALRQALDNLRAGIEETAAEIAHGQLPTVRADGTQLVQLFQNLVGNALKFRGKAPPKVHVDAVRKLDHWLFSVRDNGIGMDPEYRDRIFLIFQRLHARNEYPGTGIGLAICKKIVDRHGGRIWVESEPGQGATFHFTLPT